MSPLSTRVLTVVSLSEARFSFVSIGAPVPRRSISVTSLPSGPRSFCSISGRVRS
jgi:hypothetical protein